MEEKVKILILFHSSGGGVAKLAEFIAAGSREVENVEVEIKRIPNTPEHKSSDPEKLKAAKELAKKYSVAGIDDFLSADGVALGTPTHFGSFTAQVKHFIDQLTPAWLKGRLVNKPIAFFTTAGSMHGGEELALLSLMIPAFNLGMVPVGIPYPIQGESPDFDSGSPYGAIYVTGNRRELTDGDKKVARILGKRLAAMAHILKSGHKACKVCHELLCRLEK